MQSMFNVLCVLYLCALVYSRQAACATLRFQVRDISQVIILFAEGSNVADIATLH